MQSEKPLRVLLISSLYPSQANPAFGSFVAEQVEALRSQGGLTIKLVVNQRWKLGFPHNIFKYAILSAKVITATVKGRFDLIHAHCIFPTGAIALIPRLVMRKPLIVTTHGSDLENCATSKIKLALTRYVCHRSSRLLTVSEHQKRRVLELIGPVAEKKTDVLPMGINFDNFKPLDKEAAKKELGLSREGPIVLFVGNLVKLKGVDRLIEAAKKITSRHPGTRFQIVGEGPEKENLLRLSFIRGVSGSVSIEGFKPRNELPKWMSASDVLVLPSDREGFGLVLLEAMACGLPVVSTKYGGPADLIDDGANGLLIDPHDTDELTDKVSLLLNDPGFAKKISDEAIRTVAIYSQIETARKLKSLYESSFLAT